MIPATANLFIPADKVFQPLHDYNIVLCHIEHDICLQITGFARGQAFANKDMQGFSVKWRQKRPSFSLGFQSGDQHFGCRFKVNRCPGCFYYRLVIEKTGCSAAQCNKGGRHSGNAAQVHALQITKSGLALPGKYFRDIDSFTRFYMSVEVKKGNACPRRYPFAPMRFPGTHKSDEEQVFGHSLFIVTAVIYA